AKLRQKGIDQSIIAQTLDEELKDHDPYQDALTLARRSARSLASREPEVRQRRLIGRLARRGFDHDIVRRVVKQIESEIMSDQDQ
ncbi:MAG: RecX family transcriptional regulator, partial [Phycisphaerales bacterium]|nr:RecX family transcriptional regulator [Phycisphaerales bacterium]